ncbi:unnamed protein product, partial [Mesorhabditis spiculigera]
MSRLVLLFLAYILVAAAFPEYEGLNTTCTKSHDCQVINTAAVGICKDGKCDYELTRGFIYFPFQEYSLSFYWSALTLVTLGEQPSPQRSFQNIFEIIVTLLGLVIFAVIVGDVGNMVQTMNLKRTDYEEIFDGTRAYMLRHQVPQQLQQKIIRYLTYIWGQGQIGVDEKAISDFLPNRLYGHMAVHIHMETLRRVPLFADCDPTLLYEFILRLELQVYSPGDYICRKGEVGKEMYIVKKEDLWEALRDYPQATQSLFEKGRQILAKDNLLEETTEEHDNWDPDAPIEEKFETIRRDMEEFTKQLDEAEVMLRASMDREKQLVTKLEESFVEFFELVNRDDEHEEDSDSDG